MICIMPVAKFATAGHVAAEHSAVSLSAISGNSLGCQHEMFFYK